MRANWSRNFICPVKKNKITEHVLLKFANTVFFSYIEFYNSFQPSIKFLNLPVSRFFFFLVIYIYVYIYIQYIYFYIFLNLLQFQLKLKFILKLEFEKKINVKLTNSNFRKNLIFILKFRSITSKSKFDLKSENIDRTVPDFIRINK